MSVGCAGDVHADAALPTVEKFPRSHKFTLGDRVETVALDALEALIEATYTKDRVRLRGA